MPPVVGPVTTTLDNVGHRVANKILGCPPDCPPGTVPPASNGSQSGNGQHHPEAEKTPHGS
jgi:hypothetical protein